MRILSTIGFGFVLFIILFIHLGTLYSINKAWIMWLLSWF